MEYFVESPDDYNTLVDDILPVIIRRRKVTLTGQLGAGKTTLTQRICTKLGVSDLVKSPTFSLINVYEGHYLEEVLTIHHVDLYRLKDLDEVLDIGIESLLYDLSIVFMEWPEIAEPLLPKDVIEIKIEAITESARKVIVL